MPDAILTPQPQDPDELKETVVARLRAIWPEWEPSEGNLDWQLIAAFAEKAAAIQESVTDVLRTVFRYYGSELAGVPVIDATAATGTILVTPIDTAAGYVVREGETFRFTSPDTGGAVGFQALHDVPLTNTETPVPVVALEAGAAGSGFTGDAGHDLAYVTSARLAAPTKGGQDAEDDDTYLARLKAELALSSPRPILADDYAVLAGRMPEVAAAIAIDNYNGQTYDLEGVLAVAVKNGSGLVVSTGTRSALQTMYDAEKLPGLVVYVIDPTWTPIDVTFAITAWARDFDPDTVRQAAADAVRGYLSPATWGQPDYGETARWVLETRVRYLEVAQVIQSVEGVRYVDSLSIGSPSVATEANGDLILPGAAPLPLPRNISAVLS
jgi:hypothetical protein